MKSTVAIPPEMKTGLRRSHVKSRHGCGQCKSRRKKCDERPPVCSNCKRRKLKCDYEDLFNTESSASASSSLETAEGNAEELNIVFEFSQIVSRSAISENPPKPTRATEGQGNAHEESSDDTNAGHSPADAFPLMIQYPSNLAYSDQPGQANELIFHFLTIAGHTLAHDNIAFQYWQQIAYSIPHTHDFVRHTLLAFSSLHIAHLQPQNSQKYLMLTSHHHGIAITRFKEQVQVVDGSNCDAVFIFSALLILTELGLMHPVWNGDNVDTDPVDKLMQQLTVTRNVLVLWRDAPLFRTESMIRELVGHGRHPHTNAIVSEVNAILSYLEVLNQKMVTDLDERTTYSESIRQLGASYYFTILRPKSWFSALRWAKGISPAFLMRLKARRPLALLILAQYCVLVRRTSRNHWWMRGWSEQIFNHVVSLLDSQWMPYLRSATIAMNEDQ